MSKNKCCYNHCSNEKYFYKDEVYIFFNCDHTFHKTCLEIMLHQIKCYENNQYNFLMLEDITDDIFLESLEDKNQDSESFFKSEIECFICRNSN